MLSAFFARSPGAVRVAIREPVGARVSGMSVGRLSPGDIARLKDLLAERGVLVFDNQDTGDDGFVAFLRCFGELTLTVGEQPVPGHPDLNLVSNVGRVQAPKSTFHIDTTYVSRPPAYTALRAVRVPERGGATLFTNQYRAFDTLPADLRERLEGATIRHVVTGLDLDDDAEQAADHLAHRDVHPGGRHDSPSTAQRPWWRPCPPPSPPTK